MWLMAGIAGSLIVFLLAKIQMVTRSRLAVWYGLTFAIAILSGYSDVIATTLGYKTTVGIANTATAALVLLGAMAALAIAQQLRYERIERQRAESALRNSYDEIPIGLFTLNPNGLVLRGNPTLGEILGTDILSGSYKFSEYFGVESWRSLDTMTRSGGAAEIELKAMPGAANGLWFQLRAKRTHDRIEGSIQDITERVLATEKLTFMADHDPLTCTMNRRGIERYMGSAIENAAKGSSCAIAYLDLDRFKLINELYGHATGDEVLQQVCNLIKNTLAAGDILGRIGGDEFIIIFQNSTLQRATVICNEVLVQIQGTPFQIEDKAFRVGACIGVVEVSGSISIQDAIASADRACREAKKGVGGGLVVYEKNSPVFNERAHEMHLLKRFGVDAAPEGLFLVMQPIMSLQSPFDSLNFEVLLRMHMLDNSIEGAGRIINTAEKNGKIAIIDRWVLRHLLEWVEEHHDELTRTKFICVNLSGGSLNDERFIEDAFAMVASHPRAASRLCFEITESVALSDIENTLRFVNKVREFGSKVALDDFGVGYTSFSYLHSISADILKIDGSLVSQAMAHQANLSIIEAISNLTGNLGMTSIAEWAGDVLTIQAMAEVGIDYVQSYAVGRPQIAYSRPNWTVIPRESGQ